MLALIRDIAILAEMLANYMLNHQLLPLSRRDAAGQVLSHNQTPKTNIRINEDIVLNNTLPSPKYGIFYFILRIDNDILLESIFFLSYVRCNFDILIFGKCGTSSL